jgi:hypothetical protein
MSYDELYWDPYILQSINVQQPDCNLGVQVFEASVAAAVEIIKERRRSG